MKFQINFWSSKKTGDTRPEIPRKNNSHVLLLLDLREEETSDLKKIEDWGVRWWRDIFLCFIIILNSFFERINWKFEQLHNKYKFGVIIEQTPPFDTR